MNNVANLYTKLNTAKISLRALFIFSKSIEFKDFMFLFYFKMSFQIL